VIAPSTNLVLGIFSLRNEVNNPGHQELTQADISNVDTCVCYFAGALIAATKCLHSPSPYASLSCTACEIWVMWFERRLSRLRHRNALTVKAWEEAVQGQKEREAFILITTTSTTKLVCFRQKNQESLKIAEYSLHQSIRLGHLIIHIAFSNSNIDVRILIQGYCVAIVSLSLL